MNGKPVGNLRSELKRTCQHLGIPYGRKHGKVFHDTRHTVATHLIEAGVPDAVAMTITGHKDASVFQRYHVARTTAQKEALQQLAAHRDRQRARS